MVWIKRNLFFVVGGLLALILLGGAGFYIYKAWDRNTTAFTNLNEVVGNLKTLAEQKPSPGNEKIDNTKIARQQDGEVKAWMSKAVKSFEPIAPIPAGAATSEAYAGALRRTIDQLQKTADASGVQLPPRYDFSFSAERPLVRFAAGSIEPLAAQLGEVKAIAEILFATRINALDSIQRIRVSDDDLTGPPSDYIDQHSITNEMAVITPYVITLRCFTPELSRVMTGFAKAKSTFIIKSVNVQPAGAASAVTAVPGYVPGYGGEGAAGIPPMRTPEGYPYPNPNPAMPNPANQPVAGKGGLQTILKEQLLRVTIEVELVKLLPKS